MVRFRRLPCALLTTFLVLAYLAGLGSYALTERSEARYAGVAWEMLRSGDYLTPRYNDIKHFHKPPLFYWLCAGSMATFGPTEGAARLPCALAALGTLAVVGWWAKRREMGCESPWLAPACLGTAPFFWEMGRVAVTDMVLSFLLVLGLAAAWKILFDGPSASSLALFWGSLGLGFLDKGPVAPLILALVLLPVFRWGGGRWRDFSPWPGLLLSGVLALPWYLWAVQANPGLLDYFLKFQTVDRVFSTVHQRPGPFWFYLPVLLGGFLPWSCWLPQAIARGVKASRLAPDDRPNPDLFLLAWLLLPTLFFSLIGSKLPPYVLPIFPAVALLLARHLGRPGPREILAPLGVLILTAIAFTAQVRLGLIPRLRLFEHELGLAAIWLSLVVVLFAVLYLRKEPPDLLPLPCLAMLGLFFIAVHGMPKLDRNSAKPLVEAVHARADGPFEVAMHGGYLFGLPYYLDGFLTHLDYPRETRFETDNRFRDRVAPSVPDYFKLVVEGDKERFLIVPRPMLDSVSRTTGAPIIFRDDRWGVVHGRRKGALK